jgi:hypothetical protein
MGKLHSHVGDGVPLEETPRRVGRKSVGTGKPGVYEKGAGVVFEVSAEVPRHEVRNIQGSDFMSTLANDKGVDRHQVGRRKPYLREKEVHTVQPEGEFLPEKAQVGLTEAGTIPQDEAPLPEMEIVKSPETFYVFRPAGTKEGCV